MIEHEIFFEDYQPWQTWYTTEQGLFALAAALRLTKRMLSPWSRRGHSILHIHFDHWKTLELFWESGLDVSAVAPSLAFLESIPTHLRHMIDCSIVRPKALNQLSFADKSYDYVALTLMPPVDNYPPLHSILSEISRIATKGILVQIWNPCSILKIQNTFNSADLPSFFLNKPWFTWRDVCHTLRKQIQYNQVRLHTRSILFGSINTWKNTSYLRKLNSLALICPLGAMLQVRASFAEGIPLSGTALHLKILGKEMSPLIKGAERTKNEPMLKKFYN